MELLGKPTIFTKPTYRFVQKKPYLNEPRKKDS